LVSLVTGKLRREQEAKQKKTNFLFVPSYRCMVAIMKNMSGNIFVRCEDEIKETRRRRGLFFRCS
jgi:hypothetical protein